MPPGLAAAIMTVVYQENGDMRLRYQTGSRIRPIKPNPVTAPPGLLEACEEAVRAVDLEFEVTPEWEVVAHALGYSDYLSITGGSDQVQGCLESSPNGILPRLLLDEVKEGNGRKVPVSRPFIPRGRVVTPLRYAFELYAVYQTIVDSRANELGLVEITVLYPSGRNGREEANPDSLVSSVRLVGKSAAICILHQIEGMCAAAEEVGRPEDLEFLGKVRSWNWVAMD